MNQIITITKTITTIIILTKISNLVAIIILQIKYNKNVILLILKRYT